MDQEQPTDEVAALRRLQLVWAELSAAMTVDEVCDIVLTQGLAATGASGGGVMLVREDDPGTAELVRSTGMTGDNATDFRVIDLSLPVPLADAIATGEPVLLRSLEERDARYPVFAQTPTRHNAFAVVPLLAGDGAMFGGLHLSFEQERDFGAAEIELLVGIARQCTQALERARLFAQLADLYTREQRVRRRLAFLARAGAELSASLDLETTLDAITSLAVPHIADWCVIDLVRELDGEQQAVRASMRHEDPVQQARVQYLLDRYPPQLDGAGALATVLATGVPRLVAEVTPELLKAVAVDAEHERLLAEIGMSSAMTVPLSSAGRILGAITFIIAESKRVFDEDDVALAGQLAERAAVAIENAQLYEQAESRAVAVEVLAHIGDGVLLVDASGIVRLWNPAAETMTGVRAADVVGRPAEQAIPGWHDIADRVPVTVLPHSGSVVAEELPLLNIAAAGGARSPGSGRLRDNRDIWVSIAGVRYPEGTVYAFRDVTDERAVERMKSDFVATVSHELRTPLASVYGSAVTLQRTDIPLTDEIRQQLLSVIAVESDRLRGIINDILLASRIDSGGIELLDEEFDVAEVVRSVVESTQTRLDKGTSVDVVTMVDDTLTMRGDHDRIRQVLVNLVENAIKYSPDGGRIEVAAQQVGPGRIELVVRDQGIGIPEVEHARIFEKFYRLDPNQTRGVGGTGLGLYICRELVGRMGGRTWVESSSGDGSTFHVELPTTPPR